MDIKIYNQVKAKRTVVFIDEENKPLLNDDQILTFNDFNEAKEWFMNNYLIDIRLNVLLSSRDQNLYSSEEDFYDYDDEDAEYQGEWYHNAMEAWEEAVDDLIDECELHVDYNTRNPQMEGVYYDIVGTPNNLIKFMERYGDHFDEEGFADDGSVGDSLYEERKQFEAAINEMLKPTGGLFNN